MALLHGGAVEAPRAHHRGLNRQDLLNYLAKSCCSSSWRAMEEHWVTTNSGDLDFFHMIEGEGSPPLTSKASVNQGRWDEEMAEDIHPSTHGAPM